MVNCILFKGIVYKIQNCENEPRFPWPKGFPTLTCSLILKGHEDVISSDSLKKEKRSMSDSQGYPLTFHLSNHEDNIDVEKSELEVTNF